MLAVLIKRVLAPGMESTYEEFSEKDYPGSYSSPGLYFQQSL